MYRCFLIQGTDEHRLLKNVMRGILRDTNDRETYFTMGEESEALRKGMDGGVHVM